MDTIRNRLPEKHRKLFERLGIFMGEINESQIITCDEKCQHEKELQEAKDLYDNKRAVLQTIDGEHDNAKKNYEILLNGYDTWKARKQEELSKEGGTIIEDKKNLFLPLFISIAETLVMNNKYNKSLENTSELNDKYTEKILNILSEIDDRKNSINVANRKSYYDNGKINSWCTTNYYLKNVFWVLLIFYVILVFLSKKYNTKYVKTILIILPILGYFNGNYLYKKTYIILKKIFNPITSLLSTL